MSTKRCCCSWDFYEEDVIIDVMIVDPYCPIHGNLEQWDRELDRAYRESKPKRTKFKQRKEE